MQNNKLKIINNTAVIIVLYFPSESQIKFLSNIIENEKIFIICIDNTPNQINAEIARLALRLNSKIKYIPQLFNKGIAEAQNIGIKEALKIEEISYILFLDQDSKVEKNFVYKMTAEYIRISNLGIRISALGPTPINSNNNKTYKQEKVGINNLGKDFYSPSAVISSGMLISLKTIELVGLMESMLFIDGVDFEWCWRANSKGFKCCITKRVEMLHKVGEKDSSFLGYKVLISTPSRYYYQYRNFIIFLRRDYVPLNWKIKNLIKKIFFMFYVPIISSNKGFQILKNMCNGLKDGFLICLNDEKKQKTQT